MSKNIIFCADGTWQTQRNNSNVYKIYKGITQSSTQIAFYQDDTCAAVWEFFYTFMVARVRMSAVCAATDDGALGMAGALPSRLAN